MRTYTITLFKLVQLPLHVAVRKYGTGKGANQRRAYRRIKDLCWKPEEALELVPRWASEAEYIEAMERFAKRVLSQPANASVQV
jgi:hypothetical protein